jgi:hypothetical protein
MTEHNHALASQSYCTIFSVWCSRVQRKRWARDKAAATDILVVTVPILICENHGNKNTVNEKIYSFTNLYKQKMARRSS